MITGAHLDGNFMDVLCHYASPLGGITLACDGAALTGLWFDGQKYFGAGIAGAFGEKTLPVHREAMRWLDVYFSGNKPDFTPALRMLGTPFRRAVWEILLSIPYGKTMSYGEIAAILSKRRGGAPVSPRSVGGAVGHNPISLLIPCHRVIGADGSLTGYAGGIERKRQLLALEGIV